MSTRRIVGLPVDGRPVVRAQVMQIAAAAGWTLAMPAVADLGHLRTPADRTHLAEWLRQEASSAQGVILSLDMLVYGGLVPSRFIEDDAASLIRRLDVLRELKAAHAGLPLYAFAATMRMSNNNVNEEEKTYWSDYGTRIWAWSFHSDRYDQHGEPADRDAAATARAAIPDAIASDYLATRARNLAVTHAALDLCAAGVIDRLILPQDDTAAHGFNIAERRKLAEAVARRGLADRVAIYPGADEVMHTLTAHLIGRATGGTPAPRTIHLLWADPVRAGQVRALYEDRPVTETVAGQLAAAGLVTTSDASAADCVVAVHTRGTAQGDWAMQKPLPDPTPIDPAFIANIRTAAEHGKPVALLDLAYANGGDPALLAALHEVLPLNRLAGYAGWNTAGNSAGSLFAQCALTAPGSAANEAILALRLLEDVLWQADWRQRVRAEIDEAALTPAALHDVVATRFIPAADAWLVRHGFPFKVRAIALPWDRTFEIDIELMNREVA